MKKNTASQLICFQLLSTTDGSAITAGSPVVSYVGDGGTQSSGSGSVIHKGNGVWAYTPIQTETNYNHIVFTMTLSGAFTQSLNVYTTYPQDGDAYTAVVALNDISTADVNAQCGISLVDYSVPTKAEFSAGLATLNNLSTAEVNAACDSALVDYGANTTTPPTVVAIRTELDNNSTKLSSILTDTGTSIPNLIVTIDSVVDSIKVVIDKLEDTLVLDGAEYQFTVNALENAPSGTGASAASIADAVWDESINEHSSVDSFGSKNQKLIPSETIGDYQGSSDPIPTVAQIRAEIDTNSTQLLVLVSRLSTLRAGYLDKLNVTGTIANSDTASSYQTNVSALATSAALTTVGNQATAIKAKTDNLPGDPVSTANLTAAHAATDSILNSVLTNTGTTIPSLIAEVTSPDLAAIADAVLNETLTDLSDNELNSGQTITLRKAARALFNRFFREVTQTASTQTVKNDSGAQITAMVTSDDGTTQTKGMAT